MSLREQIVELALYYDGASPYNRKEEYVDLLTRGGQESEQTARDMMKMSSCALSIRGFWYKVGIRHKWLNERYHNGMAPRDVIEIAKSFNAVMDGKLIGQMPEGWDGDNPYVDPYYPYEGDSYYVLYPANGKGEHFGTVTKVLQQTKDVFQFEGVDGGQKNGGIMKVTRTFVKKGRYWLDKTNSKSLFYWFDADKLVATV